MDKEKIKKLLSSKNIEDVLIGWELLKSTPDGPKEGEWYPWFDIVRSNEDLKEIDKEHSHSSRLIMDIVGENYSSNELWINWIPKLAVI